MKPARRHAQFGQTYRDRKVKDDAVTIPEPWASRFRVQAFQAGMAVRPWARKRLTEAMKRETR